MRYIKTILYKTLEKQGFSGELMVTIPKKNGFGDYTSQVLLQHKLNAGLIIEDLLSNKLIDKVDILNGHLNIYLTDTLNNGVSALVEVSQFNRMKVIRDRLFDEGHTRGEIPVYFNPLTRKVNELMASLDELGDADGLDKELIQLFKRLDLGYIYRNLSTLELGGIFLLLNTCLLALERANNE